MSTFIISACILFSVCIGYVFSRIIHGPARHGILFVRINDVIALQCSLDEALDAAEYGSGYLNWTFTPTAAENLDGKAKVVVSVVAE